MRVAAARSRLDEYPLAIADGAAHVEAVARALSTFGHDARNSIEEADAFDDADTADIFHGDFARDRQVVVVRRSALPGFKISGRRGREMAMRLCLHLCMQGTH